MDLPAVGGEGSKQKAARARLAAKRATKKTRREENDRYQKQLGHHGHTGSSSRPTFYLPNDEMPPLEGNPYVVHDELANFSADNPQGPPEMP
jgi:hypothetical protein